MQLRMILIIVVRKMLFLSSDEVFGVVFQDTLREGIRGQCVDWWIQ